MGITRTGILLSVGGERGAVLCRERSLGEPAAVRWWEAIDPVRAHSCGSPTLNVSTAVCIVPLCGVGKHCGAYVNGWVLVP